MKVHENDGRGEFSSGMPFGNSMMFDPVVNQISNVFCFSIVLLGRLSDASVQRGFWF